MLWAAARDLEADDYEAKLQDAYRDGDSMAEHDFNISYLFCLPKKPAGQLDDGTDYYDAEATRPLALVNTDNRIVAAAAKRRWERTLNAFVYHS